MRLLKSSEVAELLRVPRRAVYRMVRQGRLESVRVAPNTLRFRPEAVDAFIESNIGETPDRLPCDECCSRNGHRSFCPSRKEARHADP